MVLAVQLHELTPEGINGQVLMAMDRGLDAILNPFRLYKRGSLVRTQLRPRILKSV
jgi:hypothetical protein